MLLRCGEAGQAQHRRQIGDAAKVGLRADPPVERFGRQRQREADDEARRHADERRQRAARDRPLRILRGIDEHEARAGALRGDLPIGLEEVVHDSVEPGAEAGAGAAGSA